MTTLHSEPAGAVNSATRITVLLVDDQRFVSMAVRHLLASERDIELHYCDQAADAVAFANRVTPHVILQDLVMPDIDGLTLVGLFRANPATATTPIVVLSGNDDALTRAQALAAGANDYLVKLPDRATLAACIRKQHATSQPVAAPQDSAAADSEAQSAGPDQTLDSSLIATLRQAGGPESHVLVAKVINQFLEESALLAVTLKQAAQQKDVVRLKAAAHSLKGTSNTMGARRLAALGAQLEDSLTRHPSVAVGLMVNAIDEELARVERACLRERDGAPASAPTVA